MRLGSEARWESWYFSCVFAQTSSFSFPSRQIMSRGKSLNNFFLCGFRTSWDFSFSFPNISSVALFFFFSFAFERKAAATASRFLLGDVRDFLFRREFMASIWISFFLLDAKRRRRRRWIKINCVYMRWWRSGWWRRWLPFRVRQGSPLRAWSWEFLLFLLYFFAPLSSLAKCEIRARKSDYVETLKGRVMN